jgi:hypothetical protein
MQTLDPAGPPGSGPANPLETLSKATVVLSALAAIGLEAYLGAREWPSLLPATIGAFIAAALLARLWTGGCWSIILFFAYLVPATFLLALDRYATAYQTIWWGALLGAIVGTITLRHWAVPPRWRLAIAFWGLAVSLAWPIVIAREADFTLALLSNYHTSTSGLGGPPPVVAVWILNVALTHLLGVLWFDWCFHTFSWDQPDRFRRRVIVPLAASALVCAGVASYQGLVDLHFLSGFWADNHRAAGTLIDAPGAGALLAMWTTGLLALAGVSSSGLATIVVVGAVLAWVGMYASGSRTAFFSASVALIMTALSVVRSRSGASRRWLVPVSLAAVAVVALVSVRAPWKSVNAVVRARLELPRMSVAGLEAYARDQLWNRGVPVGTVSVDMIREFPAVGVGVGSYNHLLPDYLYALGFGRFGFDNAQNWYRHQLAELGLVGSIGWIWWVASFGWLLVTTTSPGGFAAGAVRASLVGLALISCVSMPTQQPSLALSVWIFAFWYLTLSPDAQRRLSADHPIRSQLWWTMVWVVALGYAALTLHDGRSSLRPAYRALMADWEYERGWYDHELIGQPGAFRWTGSHAVSVVEEKAPYLKVTFRSGASDTPEKPMNVRFVFWVRQSATPGPPSILRLGDRSQRVVTATLSNTEPVTWYVRMPADQKTAMVEVWVSRTWRPSAFGQPDDRDLGIAIPDWTFVASPPDGAVVK